MSRPYKIDAESRMQYTGIVVLDHLATTPIERALDQNHLPLQETLDWLSKQGHLDVSGDQYTLSESGTARVNRFHAHCGELLLSFDVYASVDLAEGVFAFESLDDFEDEDEWHEFLAGDNWNDLRIAIAELKGLNPVELVFLSYASEGHFEVREGWQKDLVCSETWSTMESICNESISVEELGFDDPEDGHIDGKEFLADIVREGAELNLRLRELEDEFEDESEGEDDEDDEDEIDVEYFRPYLDPSYVSPVWTDSWRP